MAKKLNCKCCGNDFDAFPLINGKKINAYNRKYCFDCSPVGTGMRPPLHELKQAIPDGKRYCALCKDVKDMADFGRAKVPYCRECVNKKGKADRLEHKKKIVQEMGGKCQLCGFNKHLSALDFHHIDPSTKESNLAHMRTSSKNWGQVKRELAKCALLCANCHRAMHSGELTL